ncbi:hypothetical protein V6N13_061184 [Hibiscus sabdariffa]
MCHLIILIFGRWKVRSMIWGPGSRFLSPVKHLFVAGSFLPCLGLMRKHYLGLSEISLAIFFLFELDPFLDVTLLTKSSLLINQKSFSDLEALLGDVI